MGKCECGRLKGNPCGPLRPNTINVTMPKWGTSSGKLKAWELGIATTLASYAAMDWAKVPSGKQAKHGVRLLAAAGEL